MKNNILETNFGSEKRWVNYIITTRDGKKTKVPMTTRGTNAKSTDPKDWSTYADASKFSKDIGIIFTPDGLLVGIDIDKCLNDKLVLEHSEQANIEKFISEADTYTELSPSRTGLHLFLKLSTTVKLKAHRTASLPYEVYNSGRFFTVTNDSFNTPKEIRTVDPGELDTLLSIIGYPWNKTEEAVQVASTVIVLDDQELLEKMFSAKNGAEMKALYNGDTTANSGDDSAADMSLCGSLAFWTGRNYSQIERMWVMSPLGKRKKTQERSAYRKTTIDKAISGCTKCYEPKVTVKQIQDKNPELDLLHKTNKDGEKVYIQNTENVCRILKFHQDFQSRFRYDEFKNIIEILDKKWRLLEDNDAVVIQTKMSIIFPFLSKVGKDMIYDAIIKVSKDYKIDSAKDYLTSLNWDGTARVNTWLTSTYGVDNNEYHQAVASNWLKGLVKRILYPGCKFDYVLVLEGEQGTKKSTSLGVLGGDWHVETFMSTDSKDFFMQFCGKAIVEFSEGETLSKTEVKKMKALITNQSDKYRPPYERASQDFPRRCVFAMTTNQTEYLKDETGNRRWLPVRVVLPQANVEWLTANRDQLLAEATHRIMVLDETTWEFPLEATLAEQAARRITDPNTDKIIEWFYGLDISKRNDGITIHQGYEQIGNYGKSITRYEEMNIADIFRNKLFLEKKRTMLNGGRTMRWYPTDKTGNLEIKDELDLMVEEAIKITSKHF